MSFNWIIRALVKLAFLKNNPKKIKKYIGQKQIVSRGNLDRIDKRSIKVCAVQQEIKLLKNYRQYVDRMYGFVKGAVDQGVQLIAFPEENGTLILGMIPLAEAILNILSKSNNLNNASVEDSNKETKNQDIVNDDSKQINLSEILTILTPFMRSIFETTFSQLAKAFGIFIMAGSIMLEDQGKVYNRAYLFGPDGRIIGVQDKAHLVVLEMDIGLSIGSNLEVFETCLGRIAFPVCMDATYFETFKILKDKKAQIVIIPIANMEEYNYYFSLRGIWPRVQESGVYGIKSALVGDMYGFKFTGKAGVYAPMAMTLNRDGILKEADTYDRDELIICDIDLETLNHYYDEYFSDENPDFFRKYYPGIYDNM